MKSRLTLAFCVLILVLGFAFANAADEKKAASNPQQDAMMKAYMEYATPGAPHKAMQNLVGAWDANIKSWMDPSAPPTETKGISTFTSVMDGRYLEEQAEGSFNGMPFHGRGLYAYDNMKKKYVGTWIDNMGTGVMMSEGTSPDSGKTINWTGKASDPMSGKEQSYRSTMHMVSADQYHFEMFGPDPSGKEVKMMEITYNRKK